MVQRGAITFDSRQLKEYERSLRTFASRAVPFANRNTLNTAAFQGQKVARGIINKRMVVRARGKFGAPGSVLVDRAKGLNTRQQRSVLGSIAGFMVDQEFGGSKVASGKRGVPIPTTTASGEGRGARPRKRLPRKGRALREISLSRRRNTAGRSGAMSRNRKAFIQVKLAQKKGDEFVFLDLQRAPGIYRVTKSDISLVHETKRRAVDIPKNPWLKPTIDRIIPRMPGIWQKEVRKQLIRRGIKWHLA